jgi:hypothetical protein
LMKTRRVVLTAVLAVLALAAIPGCSQSKPPEKSAQQTKKSRQEHIERSRRESGQK